ncbi:Daunorubicin/doxorubicin resistance ATP-binding protein DrrA [Aquimixticola soesokkakensis]|uniref:Daunorubicin/doxorubicin resistance ATP-binding protein DrrA n=1 Tax=Aquimixticola soesokkakensis TaxID=1519096 RepID=A0A1Y5TK17_9RHOB|nr:ABC transporter ATP-binding protein [Aquimixticola soesokkakensis]SLN63769.1 Daunorubicin/doxorubicin resistance ATP-binding protein DrrA [Aquimixticola soesokkakensis]
MASSCPAISLENIHKSFGGVHALDGLTLDIAAGSFVALLGPNGAGKSTVVDIVSTLTRPDRGRARVAGLDVVAQAKAVRRKLGVVFQTPTIDSRLSVADNLAFHAALHGVARGARAARIAQVLEQSDLAPLRDRIAAGLSGGQKRRVEIARAMIHAPEVLIFDEPTTGLDAAARAAFWQALSRLRAMRAITLVVTTHYLQEVAGADRLCILNKGRMLRDCTPAALARFGQGGVQLLMQPAGPRQRAALLVACPAARAREDGRMSLRLRDRAAAEAVLARHGALLDGYALEAADLETAYLGLFTEDAR